MMMLASMMLASMMLPCMMLASMMLPSMLATHLFFHGLGNALGAADVETVAREVE